MQNLLSTQMFFRSSPGRSISLLLTGVLLFCAVTLSATADAAPLRVGIYDLPPLAFVDAKGEARGLYVDLFNYIAEEEGWSFEYVPGELKESFARLEHGEVDLLAPVAFSDDRAKIFDFTEHDVHLDWGTIIHTPGKQIETLFDLQGVEIAVVKGSILTSGLKNHLQQFHVDAQLIELDGYRQVFAAVASGACSAGISTGIPSLTFRQEFDVEQTAILFSPMHSTYAAKKGQHPQIIAAIDRHLAALKNDPQSIYHQFLDKWLHGHHYESLRKYYYWGGLLLAAVLLFGSLSLYLKGQVQGKVVELFALNRELRKKDTLLQSVISGSDDAIFVKDIAGSYLMANAAVERILQRPAAAILGRRDADFYPSEQAALIDERKQAILRQGTVVTVDEELTTPAGPRIFHSTLGPVRDGDGEVIGLFGISRDITARKHAEKQLLARKEELRRLNQQFQTVLDGIPDHLMLVSPDRKVLWMNRAAMLFSGAREELSSPIPCYCEWSHANEPCAGCPVVACLATGKAQETTLCAGGKVFGVKAFPITNARGEVESVIKLAIDITEKIKLREENDRQNRLSAVGELSAGVAHEINNPLGLILTNLSTISEAFDDIAPLLDDHYDSSGDFPFGGLPFSRMREDFNLMLKETGEAAQRIRQIVADLKDFARDGDRDVADFYLEEAVHRSLRLTDNLLRHASDHFTADLAETSIVISGCARRVEQVLVNLLANACQALPNRSCAITLTTRYDAAQKSAVIVLHDEGIGIPPENLPKLATPFFTTRQGQGGTGLGLSVSFSIIKEHHGTVHFASAPGQGTTVTITLPARISEVVS